jgi:plastocyanin
VGNLPLAAQHVTAFTVVGGLLALWALVLSGLGVSRQEFPWKGRGQHVVMGISALLVVGAIGTAIATSEGPAKAHAPAQPSGSAPTAPKGGPVSALLLGSDPTGQLKFDKTALQAPAGNVRITLKNPAPVPHNVSLQGPGGVDLHGATVSTGGSSEVTADLKPGSYTFYCSVPGHRQAGMQGTLTVK